MAKKAAAPATIEEKMQAALVPAEEQPYAVPGNWCWVKHNSILDISGGAQPDKSYFISEIKEGYTQLYQTRDYGEHPVPVYIPNKYATKTSDEGDILLARYGGSLGKVFRAKRGAYNVALAKVVKLYPCLVVDDFLYQYYLSHFYQEFCVKAASGRSAQSGFNRNDMEELIFPLPPLAEQQRIVDRIETMFTKLDEAKEKAQAVIDGYEYRRAAILYRAFAGELTKEWENKHISNDFSPWQETKFGDIICSIEAGKNWNAEGRPPEGEEFGVVKVSSVTWGEFDELESKTCMIPEQWNPEKQIRQGDFLFSRANTLQLVGNCVIVKSVSRRLMLSDKILRFHFTDSILPAYILYFTRSQQYRRQIEELASGNQDGMRNVSQQNLRKVQIPTPSKAEQREIVRILDDFLAKEAAVKEAAETTLATIDTMKQSILSRAFRGELGTNDPNDEPAEELLKRVLA